MTIIFSLFLIAHGLVHAGLAAAPNPDDPDVKLLAEGGWANQDRMERLVNSIRQSDAIQASMVEAENHIKRALEKLLPLHPGTERSALEDLAKYIIDRRL